MNYDNFILKYQKNYAYFILFQTFCNAETMLLRNTPLNIQCIVNRQISLKVNDFIQVSNDILSRCCHLRLDHFMYWYLACHVFTYNISYLHKLRTDLFWTMLVLIEVIISSKLTLTVGYKSLSCLHFYRNSLKLKTPSPAMGTPILFIIQLVVSLNHSTNTENSNWSVVWA